jgi:hypothetical protein
LQSFGTAIFGEGPFIAQSNTLETRYFDQSTGAFNHAPQVMIRKDESVTTPAEMSSSLVLYNRNGTNNTGTKLVFVANESTASNANPVATAAIVSQKVTGSAGNWATGNLKFLVKNSANYVDVMTITSGGLVGIGNTAPSEVLHVTGRIRATTIDSTATAMNMLYSDATGVIKKAAVPLGSGTITTAEADISSNYTVTATDHFVYLPALESAGRNVVLPNDAANGRVLIIFNTSNDGTYKWTFTNEDVEDAAGAAVTTLTNQKSYTMVYYAGKFRITAIN